MASSRVLLLTLGTLLAASAVGYYFYQKRTEAAAKPPVYNTAVIAKGSIRQAVTATGQLAPLLEVDVGSQISGLVIKLHADFNTQVKKDQILVEIDPATYQQRLRQAKADLASTQASNRLQQLNTERTRELFEKKLVTQQELDQAEAQLAQSNAQLLTREAAVENANVDLARCTIRSPIDGIVIAKQTEEGKTVAASLNAPVLFTIANDLAKMQITAAVAEADIGSVREGQAVTFTVDAFPNRSFNGRVSQVRNAAKTVSNVVTYDTIIDVDNRDLRLRPGMTANVSIIVASREDTLRLPNAALRVRLPEANGSTAPATPTAASAPASGAPSGPPAATAQGPRPAGGGEGGSGGGGGGRRGGGMFGPDATPEQREKMRALMTEVGITNFREASQEQRDQFRKLATERGLIQPEAAPGEVVVSTRTIYRLPGGDKSAKPEAVTIKVGITDGVASEIIEGLKEGDTIITGLQVTGPGGGAAPAPSNNPFGGGQRRF
ncbi:efflux RND transporter periplasmic adaptor subunit [Oleiharenicola lentus]|jgi:HlyD family secretion protein|uniref:Efflux RND transporter periplasmic adaptor subunit n=1 Tax=Oleiharenicola lentus TaxID=2508720 RepID=A0A4Q1C9X2_9BACT|nr:efflux RND transporter periplasmic adaptor subunit [Oleiharenicola lentus]RXK55825.1 efflux RND transporter periplasmic adaptor subunit [Oleiharenicola lentus]